VANSKAPELIGKRFSHRDYFHGKGGNTEDLRKWGPIQQPHFNPFEAAIRTPLAGGVLHPGPGG
jgi:hypothetical protein